MVNEARFFINFKYKIIGTCCVLSCKMGKIND